MARLKTKLRQQKIKETARLTSEFHALAFRLKEASAAAGCEVDLRSQVAPIEADWREQQEEARLAKRKKIRAKRKKKNKAKERQQPYEGGGGDEEDDGAEHADETGTVTESSSQTNTGSSSAQKNASASKFNPNGTSAAPRAASLPHVKLRAAMAQTGRQRIKLLREVAAAIDALGNQGKAALPEGMLALRDAALGTAKALQLGSEAAPGWARVLTATPQQRAERCGSLPACAFGMSCRLCKRWNPHRNRETEAWRFCNEKPRLYPPCCVVCSRKWAKRVNDPDTPFPPEWETIRQALIPYKTAPGGGKKTTSEQDKRGKVHVKRENDDDGDPAPVITRVVKKARLSASSERVRASSSTQAQRPPSTPAETEASGPGSATQEEQSAHGTEDEDDEENDEDDEDEDEDSGDNCDDDSDDDGDKGDKEVEVNAMRPSFGFASDSESD